MALQYFERILSEQRECADYLRSDGPDKQGAWAGLCDWVMEEALVIQDYEHFLSRKLQEGTTSGFDPRWIPSSLFDFQQSVTAWNISAGKSALFADCGMGKSACELVWAENVIQHTNKPVLLLTPIAVGIQMQRESEKFGVEARRAMDGKVRKCVNIANYERLHYFDPSDFGGVVCDESSAIKAMNGKRRAQVTEFMRTVPYRLLATATAAPNDYVELGTSSEALGVMGQTDMLTRFFKNDNNTVDTRQHGDGGWRFKGHAETPFFRWVCGWARAGRKPSDFGPFDNGKFVLPELVEREHIVETKTLAPGKLYATAAENRQEELEERRRTIPERCEFAAEMAASSREQFVIWCDLNDEGDLLEKLIPDARQVAGSTSDDAREEIYEAFTREELRVIVIKKKIGAWGVNWQNCHRVIEFASHSFEQHYQAVRRCWRFGQIHPVTVDLIATEGQRGIKHNMQRKSAQADRMFRLLVEHMHDSVAIGTGYSPNQNVEVPAWL